MKLLKINIYYIMLFETIVISVFGTVGTNILIELCKFIKKKSRCRMRVDLGDKSEEEIIKKDEKIKLKDNK